MKKFLYLFFIGLSLSCISLYAVEHFYDATNPNTGETQHYFLCENNKIVRIIKFGNRTYKFYSDGGRDQMRGDSLKDVAQHVCKYYLDSY